MRRHVPGDGVRRSTVRACWPTAPGCRANLPARGGSARPGVSVAGTALGERGSGTVFSAAKQRHYCNLGYALLGEAAARLSRSGLVRSGRRADPRAAGDDAHVDLPQEPYARGQQRAPLANTRRPSPPRHRRDGAGRPAVEHGRGPGRFAAFLSFGNPTVIADQTLTEMREPAPPAVDYGLGVRLLPYADGVLSGHTGSMPGFQATLFVDPLAHVGVVALTNATTGFSGSELALALLGRPHADTGGAVEAGRVGARPGPGAARLLALGKHRVRGALAGRAARVPRPSMGGVVDEQFELRDDRIIGVAGYHHGETLHVVRREDGSVDHLECATFVYTWEPYPDGP